MATTLVSVSELRRGPIIRQGKNKAWKAYYLERGKKGAKIRAVKLNTTLSATAEDNFAEWKRQNPTAGMRANGHAAPEPRPAPEPEPEPPARRAYKKKARPAAAVLVGLLASQMNAIAVTLGLLQEAIGEE